MGLRMKIFNYYESSLKNLIFREAVRKKYRGELPEREGAWTVCRLKDRLSKEEEDGLFEGGDDTQCPLCQINLALNH